MVKKEELERHKLQQELQPIRSTFYERNCFLKLGAKWWDTPRNLNEGKGKGKPQVCPVPFKNISE